MNYVGLALAIEY